MDGTEIRVDFDRLPWEHAVAGLRTKTLVRAGRRARLLELREGFVEADWCTRGHAFHVLEGGCSLETRGGLVALVQGDVGLIPRGAAHGHKLVLGSGERALLLVFDEA
jgi:quercetin dioxygenase-like cupin family protein